MQKSLKHPALVIGFAVWLAACAPQSESYAPPQLTAGAIEATAPEALATCPAPQTVFADIEARPAKNGTPMLPVMINGQPFDMTLDTGTQYSVLQYGLIAQIGLDARDSSRGPMLSDAAGQKLSALARPSSFKLGGLTGGGTDFLMIPDTGYDAIRYAQTGRHYAGNLGADILSQYDVELDMATHRFRLLQQDKCLVGPAFLGGGFTAMPLLHKPGHSPLERPYIEVSLNGRKVMALVDTAAVDTIIDTDFAEKTFGLTIDRDALPETGTGVSLSGEKFEIHAYQFHSLKLSYIEFPNPKIKTADLSGEKLVLGMKQLKELHLYFANGTERLYFKRSEIPGS